MSVELAAALKSGEGPRSSISSAAIFAGRRVRHLRPRFAGASSPVAYLNPSGFRFCAPFLLVSVSFLLQDSSARLPRGFADFRLAFLWLDLLILGGSALLGSRSILWLNRPRRRLPICRHFCMSIEISSRSCDATVFCICSFSASKLSRLWSQSLAPCGLPSLRLALRDSILVFRV